MKLDINKLEFKNVSPNIYQIFHDNNILQFWTPKILAPFGIDTEYNKQLIKLELDVSDTNKYKNEHIHLKKIIQHIEKFINKKFEIGNEEFKSVIKNRPNKNDMLECRIKTIKNNILTTIEYEDKDNNYLKTIYDLPKQSYIKAQIEINGLWDYRNENKDKNKIGLIIYIKKIIVLK